MPTAPRSFWVALVWTALVGGLLLSAPAPTAAQPGDDYDASWYDPEAPHLQIAVISDGVYRVRADALRDALPDGTTLSDISPETIRLLEHGTEIPIEVEGTEDGSLDPSDTITFVGRRNRGTDELWAYNGDASAQSSTYRSLYSDTTHYWMTWGGASGLRYESASAASSSPTTALRDTVRIEQDRYYYFGRSGSTGNPLYTESEGYYWRRFRHSDTDPISATYTLPVGRRADTDASLDLRLRFDAETSSCHRVEIEGELHQSDGSVAFKTLQTVEDSSYQSPNRFTIETSLNQERVPEAGLELRITSYNDGFSDDDCPDPSNTPNHVLFDWAEATYTRSLSARSGDWQHFVAPTPDATTFALSGHSGDSVRVYAPADTSRYVAAINDGTASVNTDPSTAPMPYWAVGSTGYKAPAAIQPDASSNWSNPEAHGADYLLLTTEALLPAAQQLADYREAHDGYRVEVALVQNVFDEFDYGRPTPIAIRRFVHATQDWNRSPQFLSIFGDAQYPIRDGSVDTIYPEWSVPSFGYAPSDGWYAMQSDGPDDWSELLAVGRIPVRSVAQGELFLEKLQTYESAPLARWQKRMLLLAGGTNEGEQSTLQSYSNCWGAIASQDTVTSDNVPSYCYRGPGYTGADTTRYYKRVNDPLDDTFQDSLAVDLKRGAGWLNYFGHSAAQTWEIVTEDPPDWENAGRLPIVISLGCRTGSFAGGRFEEKSAPSLGEQLVVGSVRADGTPRDGGLNGGIAHFGESALGNLTPSARLNDALVQRVFVDTMRVLGEAIRTAKADIDADFGNSDFYVKHLLQYGLLGDPATNMALPARPDLHVSENLIATEPTAPVPSDELTVTTRVQNRGLIPADSVTARFSWERADGTTTQRTRRLKRFSLERTLPFSFALDERAVGTNTFRVTADPTNEYDELSETNNTAERTQVVFDTGVSILSPTNYGTVASKEPSLEFTLSGQATDTVPVILQLDTVPDFSSPARRDVQREVEGLRGTWQPSGLSSNQTYYWRARMANAGEETWQTTRFTVDPTLPARSWLQQRRLFTENAHTQLNHSGRAWMFSEFSRQVRIRSNFGEADFRHGFIIDGTSNYEYLQFGFGVLVMDGATGRVRDSESFPTYDLEEQYEDDVGDQQEAIDALAAFLEEVAQEGDYVFVRTRHLARQSGPNIPEEVKSLFRNLGTSELTGEPHSEAIDSLSYRDLWTMKARKGDPAATIEQVKPDTNQIGQIERPSFSYPSGTTTSPRIGPASEWSSLQWTGSTPDDSDALSINVLAADSTVLIDDLSGRSGEHSLSSIDAGAHPYLYLRATLTDSTDRTAPQLQRWSVSHTGVPELAVDPSGLGALSDTLRQGERASAALPVVNFGPVASAPVRVRTTVQDASNTTTPLSTDTLSALPPNGGRDTTSLTFSSTEFPGANVLTTQADADGPPERLTSNNTAVRTLFVERDEAPPSVRVLANGRELPPTSDDVTNLQAPELPFVSTQPTLAIHVRDDNPHLVLDDTSHVDLYLKGGLPRRGPGLGTDFRRISFAGDALDFVPPDSGTTDPLRLRFEPDLAARDSTYTLKVEAEDTRGNAVEPYQGSFRVQQEQVIRDVYPYPNPMNTHTTFAFRVEGGRNETLRDFTLRIYTLSGRLVRQLEERHLDHPLRVGWNTLPWNGRDEDGDRVATGVYLYRVNIEGADTTFRGDVEKVTVIR